jgi:hypothetical protein
MPKVRLINGIVRVIGVVTLYVAVLSAFGCTHVTDESLKKKFSSHAAQFEELRSMLSSDVGFVTISRRVIVTRTKTLNSPRSGLERVGLSPDRYAHYLQLFDALDLKGGVSRNENGIWFRAETPSVLNGDSTKGYVYSQTDRAPCVADLDAYVPPPNARDQYGGFVVYARLKPKWYLYKLVN